MKRADILIMLVFGLAIGIVGYFFVNATISSIKGY